MLQVDGAGGGKITTTEKDPCYGEMLGSVVDRLCVFVVRHSLPPRVVRSSHLCTRLCRNTTTTTTTTIASAARSGAARPR